MARPFTNVLQFVYALPRFYGGRIFFVDSTYGSNAYQGNLPHQPLRSITYALTKCVDDEDDLIIVLNGYNNTNTDTETNGDDTPIDLNKNSVTILFQGRNNIVRAIGANDSIFKMNATQVTLGVMEGSQIQVASCETGSTTATIVEFAALAADCEVFGMQSNVAAGLDGYDEFFTLAATSHRPNIHHNRLVGDGTDSDEYVVSTGAVAGIRIEHNEFYGAIASGIDLSNAAVTHVVIKHNFIEVAASMNAVKGHASATGLVAHNFADMAAASMITNAFVGAKLNFFENYAKDDEDKSGLLDPVVAA